MPKYSIRTTQTASGATAVQVVWYEGRTTHIAAHIGSAHTDDELTVLRQQAEQYVAEHTPQLALFQSKPERVVVFDQLEATCVSHSFAREVLLAVASQCGLLELLVTEQGFPLMHKVLKANTFEGHTMLTVVKDFQARYGTDKPIIVADGAMLSRDNMRKLDDQGYYYIVGARLANAKSSFIDTLCNTLPKHDCASVRLAYDDKYDVVCAYSEARYKKGKRELDKQIEKAKALIARQEPGKRAKFVKARFHFFSLTQRAANLLSINLKSIHQGPIWEHPPKPH